MEFLKIGVIEFIDIALVSILIYQLYKLIKGTVAINIFVGLASIYLLWKLFSALNFQLLSEILGQFIGVGVIILAIIFQQELRRFLMLIGKGKIIKNNGLLKFKFDVKNEKTLNISAIKNACNDMSESKTGAIIIITLIDDLEVYAKSGVKLNSEISSSVLKSIFFKNSPLHDGAVIIRNNQILSAKCILPVTNDDEFPEELGMRHRAAVGITEQSDALAIIVSEETGMISYVKDGELFNDRSAVQLEDFLTRFFLKNKKYI